jgi:hypothetical protein
MYSEFVSEAIESLLQSILEKKSLYTLKHVRIEGVTPKRRRLACQNTSLRLFRLQVQQTI